jgi:hypothetical protein
MSMSSIDIFRTWSFDDLPRRPHVHTWDAALCRRALFSNTALVRTPSVKKQTNKQTNGVSQFVQPPRVLWHMHSLGVLLFMSLLFLEPAPHMYTDAFLLHAVGCFMSLFGFDFVCACRSRWSPCTGLRLCQGTHVIFLPSFLHVCRGFSRNETRNKCEIKIAIPNIQQHTISNYNAQVGARSGNGRNINSTSTSECMCHSTRGNYPRLSARKKPAQALQGPARPKPASR